MNSIPWDGAEKLGAKQSQQVGSGPSGVGASGQLLHPILPHVPLTQELEILQPCHSHILAPAQGSELACTASLGQLQTGSRHILCGSLPLLWLVQTGNCPHCEVITPRYPDLSSDCPLP